MKNSVNKNKRLHRFQRPQPLIETNSTRDLINLTISYLLWKINITGGNFIKMEDNHNLIPFIKKRKNVDIAQVKLETILELDNMGQYLSICSDRIADASLIDGKDISIDFFNFPNLNLTEDGIMLCSEILLGYIKHDTLMNIWKYTKSENKIRELMNNQLSLLRRMTGKDLRNFIKNPEKFLQAIDTMDDDILKKIIEQCKAELESRNLFNRIKIWFINYSRELYVRVRYAELISALRESYKSVN